MKNLKISKCQLQISADTQSLDFSPSGTGESNTLIYESESFQVETPDQEEGQLNSKIRLLIGTKYEEFNFLSSKGKAIELNWSSRKEAKIILKTRPPHRHPSTILKKHSDKI